MKKKKQMTVRLPAKLHLAVKKAAAKNNRSINQEINVTLGMRFFDKEFDLFMKRVMEERNIAGW